MSCASQFTHEQISPPTRTGIGRRGNILRHIPDAMLRMTHMLTRRGIRFTTEITSLKSMPNVSRYHFILG